MRRILGSVHVSLQTLVTGERKVDLLCDLGVLLTEPSMKGTTAPREKVAFHCMETINARRSQCQNTLVCFMMQLYKVKRDTIFLYSDSNAMGQTVVQYIIEVFAVVSISLSKLKTRSYEIILESEFRFGMLLKKWFIPV